MIYTFYVSSVEMSLIKAWHFLLWIISLYNNYLEMFAKKICSGF